MLHHLGAWLKVESVIVSGAYCVTWRVGKLQLDMLVWPALLMQDRAGEPPKAVAGHYAAVAHTF